MSVLKYSCRRGRLRVWGPTVSTPAPKGVDTAYASSRSDIPRLACSSSACLAKHVGAAPLATFARMSSISCVYNSMSICRCLITSAFHGAKMVGTYFRAGYLSTAYFPGILQDVRKVPCLIVVAHLLYRHQASHCLSVSPYHNICLYIFDSATVSDANNHTRRVSFKMLSEVLGRLKQLVHENV